MALPSFKSTGISTTEWPAGPAVRYITPPGCDVVLVDGMALAMVSIAEDDILWLTLPFYGPIQQRWINL